jgi:hypothetical protein
MRWCIYLVEFIYHGYKANGIWMREVEKRPGIKWTSRAVFWG